MDLRYLEFLLTAYSWIAILLCGILIIWLIRLPITEINLLVVKVKTEISKHIMDGIVFVMLIVCLNPMNIIQHRITDEVANLRLQYAYQYSSDPDDSWRRKEDARRAAIKKQWEGLYDELTHSKNTAVFAFIRYDPDTNELTKSDVQNVLWYIITWVPPSFLLFWWYILIRGATADSAMFGMFGDLGVLAWPILGIAAGAFFLWWWITTIQNGYTEIRGTVLEIATLANMRLE